MSNRVAFLCDANADTGYGHLMRSLRLALTLSPSGIEPLFIGNFSQRARAFADDFEVDMRDTKLSFGRRMQELCSDVSGVVIDTYEVTSDEFFSEQPIVLIDDYCQLPYFSIAGAINFTLGAIKYDYVGLGAAAQALGPEYFLPHPSLNPQGHAFRETVNRILVIIGSNDRHGAIPRVLDALAQVRPGSEVRVLGTDKTDLHRANLEVEGLPFTGQMQQHHDWSDFCITSGGLAKYECAWLARPAAVIANSSDEHRETREFAAGGLCFDLGTALNLDDRELRHRLATILDDTELRRSAHAECRAVFDPGSSSAAARFTARCLGIASEA